MSACSNSGTRQGLRLDREPLLCAAGSSRMDE